MTDRCRLCPCAKTSQQVVFGDGNEEAPIVSVGEAPGPDEDVKGQAFVGRAGKVYEKLLEESKIARADIWTDNTVKCFPGRTEDGKIAKPSPECIETCTKHWLFPTLLAIKPKVVLSWGTTATEALLGRKVVMGDVLGGEFETPYGIVIPVYHPSYLMRNQDDYTSRRKVLERMARAKHLAGLSEVGTYVDQTKVKHHQEDKRVIQTLTAKSALFNQNPWKPDRHYITAWTDKRDIVLVYKDDHDNRYEERITDFKWYFYLKTSDVIALGNSFWKPHIANGTIFDFEIDPVNEEWTMVYADRQIIRTRALREHLLEGGTSLWRDNQIEKYEADRRLRKVYDELDKRGIQHYEGDLPPLRRFMTDYDINISTEYNELYMDIETDDTLPLGDRKTLADRRILSVAYELIFADKHKEVEKGVIVLESETDAAEIRLLQKFAKVMAKADIMYAWNGNNFDFPIVRDRMFMHGVRFHWDYLQVIDLLRTWFRYFQRGATVNTSFSLQNIAKHVLKQAKIDWKERAAERGLKISKMLQLYRQAPDIMAEYNADDVHKMVELEKFMGFAKIDQLFCRIGNCFPRDYHITTKIDALLLKRGKYAGVHWPSWRGTVMGGDSAYLGRSGSGEMRKRMKADSYEGGYVLPPERGLHFNVAALDFKSLYPSVMMAFNISPEVFVSPEDMANYDPKSLVTCPSGATFKLEPAGFIPTIFAHTGERRKVYQQLQSEQEVGSDLFLLYYRLAYSFKRLGLSFYGEMGNSASRYYNTKVAEAVTLSGQYLIKQSVEIAKQKGYKPLYGDTDSLYVAMPASDGMSFVNEVNTWLRKHLQEKFNVPEARTPQVELEYENYFEKIFFVRKKRYAGLMTMYKGKEASFTEVKGLECMRSDGLEYTRQMQRTIIEMIVREVASPMKILDFFCHERDKVLNNQLQLGDLTITKGITKNPESYKGNLVHVELAKYIRDTGIMEYYVGMKIPYIVTSSKPKVKAILAEEYKGTYDAAYYWDRLIFPASYRIVSAVYPTIAWDLLFTKPLTAAQKTGWAGEKDYAKGNGHGPNGDGADTEGLSDDPAEASIWG